MSVMRVHTSFVAAAERTPPVEIQLWNAGENPTDYGVHVWNERSTREVLARYSARGNPILIDVEHNGATLKDGEPAVTGGYARLEIRSGAPWLVFDWSEYGREQIESGQRRFLSPEYDVDKETGEILALYRVSLVADPGTHRARMLASAETGKGMDPTLEAILAVLNTVEDPAAAVESIKSLVAKLKGGGDEAPADPPTTEPEPVTTETDDEKKSEDEEKMKATSKPKAQAPKLATPPAVEKQSVTAAASAAVAQIKAAHRDHLLATQGDRLEPSIRRWASSQPLEVVEGLLAATPAKDVAKERAKATRGNGSSGELSERELKKCKARGIDPAKYAEMKSAMTGGK